jgi:3-phenylpropionate/cinnamic acid dioxygenase small subunit
VTAAPSVTDALIRPVEQFLFHEARLLDERRWAEWLELFTPDGMYWAPLERGQTDPVNRVSLFYENAMLRAVRARRLDERNAWSQQPVAQTQHLVGNVQIEAVEAGGAITVRSAFHMIEWHRAEQRLLGGTYTHRLLRADDGFKIVLKRIDIVNCDAVHDSLETFL